MRVRWHQLARQEPDHEIIWLSVSLATLGCAAAWLWMRLPWPPCALHELTGLACPTCGATRCAIQFFHAQFLSALSWNPLVFFTLLAVGIFDLYALVVLTARLPRLRLETTSVRATNALRIAAITILALNWFYELHRLA